MSLTIVKDWTTKAGLRAVILFIGDSHHCGYVAVNNTHPLYKKPYNEGTSALGKLSSEEMPLGKRSPVFLFTYTDGNIFKSPEMAFAVHGGLTFSDDEFCEGRAPNAANLWWFGFDCAHVNDALKHDPIGIFRDAAYVEQECESLAQQIARFPYTL